MEINLFVAKECQEVFLKAYDMVEAGQPRKARALIYEETDIQVFEFALALYSSHSHKQYNSLKNTIRYVLCAIEIDKPKNWKNNEKGMKEKTYNLCCN